MEKFIPTSLKEGQSYYDSFTQFDIIFVTGDPYYDHPLNGVAILSRLLNVKGYKVGIIAQPETKEDFTSCGKPRYFFCITSGLLDSMLANYTPMLHKRENVLVPERALILYTQKIKESFKDSITIIGGVEATIRRFTHFDYKENKLRRSILQDSKADVLIHGNADRTLLEILKRLKEFPELPFQHLSSLLDCQTIDGLSFRIKKNDINKDLRNLPSYEDCVEDPKKFSLLTRTHYLLPDDAFIEPCGLGFIQHNRPSHPLTEQELDLIYEQPFTRKLHPNSKNFNFNYEMVERLETSVILGRGCWGSCNFCVIPLVQGKEVAKRSKESILKEIETLYKKGYTKINDLTLPTLNMYGSSCNLYNVPQIISSPIINEDITVYNKEKYCNQQCGGCPQRVLRDDLYPLLEGIEKLQRKYPGTSLELRSAIRHDIILEQKELFRKIMQFTTRLKIAPEHISNTVLKQMNKGTRAQFEEFLEEYKKINEEQGTHKNLVPYFIAGHPGSTMNDMELLRKFCKEKDIYVNLTQVFTPTPGTASTAAYYTAEDTFTKEKIHVPRNFREKKDQKNVLVEDIEFSKDDESG
ncbi:radical SAM protein [Candidatus Woesearchaeota archaeon]|nr:radical SAM protein [Candidatus Woesearchaeota archaeon]